MNDATGAYFTFTKAGLKNLKKSIVLHRDVANGRDVNIPEELVEALIEFYARLDYAFKDFDYVEEEVHNKIMKSLESKPESKIDWNYIKKPFFTSAEMAKRTETVDLKDWIKPFLTEHYTPILKPYQKKFLDKIKKDQELSYIKTLESRIDNLQEIILELLQLLKGFYSG